MTWITDDNGTRWVDATRPKKRRRSPRALRFADVKVGDQLMNNRHSLGMDYPLGRKFYVVVTDLWFDPVAGQDDPVKGRMVGYRQIDGYGRPIGSKIATTIRGLASQQFQYADIDYIALAKSRAEAVKSGDVVGIGQGRVIRQRPRTPGSRL